MAFYKNTWLFIFLKSFIKIHGFYIGKRLAFIDSLQFLDMSLEKLASIHPEDIFLYTRDYFPDEEQFNLVKKKGIYPYDYMDGSEKFNDLNCLLIKIFIAY